MDPGAINMATTNTLAVACSAVMAVAATSTSKISSSRAGESPMTLAREG